MNQTFQMVQTFLILALCIVVAFVVGRSFNNNEQTHATSEASNSAMALYQINDFKERLNRMETKADQQFDQWQSFKTNFSQLQNLCQSLKEKIEDTSKSTEYMQLFQNLEKEIAHLKQATEQIQKQTIRPSPPTQLNNKQDNAAEAKPKDNRDMYKASYERQATQLFETIKPKFHEYMALRRYNDARYKLINFPKEYSSTDAGQKVQQLLKQIDKQMYEDYERSEKLAQNYVKNGQIEDALQLLRNVPDIFPGKEDIHKRAEQAIADLKEQWKSMHKSAAYNAPGNEEIQKLIEKMGSDDLKVVIEAKKELAGVGRQSIIDIRKATEHTNAKIRWGAVALLGQFEDHESEHILITALRDSDPQVRFSSLEALEKIKSYRAIEEVIKTTADKDFRVARRAIEAFETITEHTVTIKGIEVNKNNIENLKEIMTIYWEKNRSRFLNS